MRIIKRFSIYLYEQLETIEQILKECPPHLAERTFLRKVSSELDMKVLLDTKNDLGAVVILLDTTSLLMVCLMGAACQKFTVH